VKSLFFAFPEICGIVHLSFCAKEILPMRVPSPFSTPRRNDSKTFQLTLKRTCGLPELVCADWQRRSFLDLPEELSSYRYPKTKSDAKTSAVALIACLKQKQAGGGAPGLGT
jgi:hypothetical protein